MQSILFLSQTYSIYLSVLKRSVSGVEPVGQRRRRWNPKTCNQFLNNIQRKAYTCHSERSATESNPQGNGLPLESLNVKFLPSHTLLLPRLDYDKRACRLSAMLPSSTVAHNDRRGDSQLNILCYYI